MRLLYFDARQGKCEYKIICKSFEFNYNTLTLKSLNSKLQMEYPNIIMQFDLFAGEVYKISKCHHSEFGCR